MPFGGVVRHHANLYYHVCPPFTIINSFIDAEKTTLMLASSGVGTSAGMVLGGFGGALLELDEDPVVLSGITSGLFGVVAAPAQARNFMPMFLGRNSGYCSSANAGNVCITCRTSSVVIARSMSSSVTPAAARDAASARQVFDARPGTSRSASCIRTWTSSIAAASIAAASPDVASSAPSVTETAFRVFISKNCSCKPPVRYHVT